MKSCVIVLFVTTYIVGSFSAVRRETFVCQKGISYEENECNECICVKPDDFVCTLKKCPENAGRGIENCETGSVWKEGCRKCWCTNVGQICTTSCS